MIEGTGPGGENCMNRPGIACYPASWSRRFFAALFADSSFETRISWTKKATIPMTLPMMRKTGVVSCQRSISHPIPT